MFYYTTELNRVCYKPTGGRLFSSIYYQTQDDAFKLVAQNWRMKITAQESFNPAVDLFYAKEVLTEGGFVDAWNEIKNTALKKDLSVWVGHMLTHVFWAFERGKNGALGSGCRMLGRVFKHA